MHPISNTTTIFKTGMLHDLNTCSLEIGFKVVKEKAYLLSIITCDTSGNSLLVKVAPKNLSSKANKSKLLSLM